MNNKTRSLYPLSHLTFRALPEGGVELGYTHHVIHLGPDPKGLLFKEAWPVFRRRGMSFRTEDYRRLLSELRGGKLDVTEGGRYQPPAGFLQPGKWPDLEYPLEVFLSNGVSFVVMKSAKKAYLEIGLKGHLPLLFDITVPGYSYEQALMALEKKWPERYRG